MMSLKKKPLQEAEMIIQVAAPKTQKVVAKRKKTNKQLTFEDVRIAARGGESAFRYYVENGKLPVSK